MDISKFLDWIKLSPKYLAAIALFAGLLLFAPRSFTETMGLLPIIEQYRTWIGLAFFLTISLLVAHAFVPIIEFLKDRWLQHQVKKAQIKRLRNLTNGEKAILRGYIERKSRTQYLEITDGVVSGLETMNIIYRATSLSIRSKFAFNIQVWIYDYLQEHQDLLREEKK